MSSVETINNYLKGRAVTLDCNILILLIVGSIGENHIRKFKRTNQYTYDDYLLLVELIKMSTIVLTPNVLTEASNLLEQYEFYNQRIGLKNIENIISQSNEIYTKSNELVKLDTYLKFGLADSSIYNLCKKGIMAITVDLPLYGYLSSKSLPVINFNHYRTDLN